MRVTESTRPVEKRERPKLTHVSAVSELTSGDGDEDEAEQVKRELFDDIIEMGFL